MFWNKKFFRSVKYQLMFRVWLVTSTATLLLTAGQIAFDYSKELKQLQSQHRIIAGGYLNTLAKSLWDVNTSYMELQLQSIKNLNNVKYIELISEGKVEYVFGEPPPNPEDTRQYPLKADGRPIGILSVAFDVKAVQDKFMNKVLGIASIQTIKTFLTCFILLLIFYKTVVVHVQKINGFLRDLKLQDSSVLSLDRPPNFRDEFAMLTQNINKMKRRLSTTQMDLETINSTLEARVFKQTKSLNEKNIALEKAMDNLIRAKKQIVTQEKLAALGKMSASIGHEIKNPLNLITNSAKIMNSLVQEILSDIRLGDIKPEEVEEQCRQIEKVMGILQNSSQRADGIIKNMLFQFGNKSSLPVKVDLEQLATRSLNLCMAARPDICGNQVSTQLDIRCDENIAVFEAELERVLINLIDNALFALNSKLLADTTKKFRPEIKIEGYRESADYFKLIIRDNGPGVSQETQSYMFDPFYTEKTSRRGNRAGSLFGSRYHHRTAPWRDRRFKYTGKLYTDRDSSPNQTRHNARFWSNKILSSKNSRHPILRKPHLNL